jgi:hypothetical protein
MIGMCRSRDGGVSWKELSPQLGTCIANVPGSLAAAELVEAETGRLMMVATWFDRSDPDRPLFDPQTEGILRSKQLRAFSDDDGDTWSEWEVLPTLGLTGCAGTGPILQWSDGTIAYAFESFKEFDDPRPAFHAAWLLPSRDGGRTFGQPVLVARCPEHKVYYWDQRLHAGPRPGEFIGLFWTHDRSQQKDLTVHACQGTLSADGVSHASIWQTTIPGQIAAPLLLDNGRWLAFVVDRNRPAAMTLWTSSDGGRTWPTDQALVVYRHDERAKLSQGAENIDFKAYWEDMGKWSFGHPVIRRWDPTRVLVSYYAGTPECMSIYCARIRI